MKTAAFVLAVAMLTVEQRDSRRSYLDQVSSAVSAGGEFVAFTTYSQLAPADINYAGDIYVLDRARQRVTLESAGIGGDTGDCVNPGISGDGRLVAFERANTVIVRNRLDATTRMLGTGRQPALTENGRVVVFSAPTCGTAAGTDPNGEKSDICAADLQHGTVLRVSVDLTGLDAAAAASVSPSTSGDGRYIAFASMVRPQGTRTRDPQVFVRDTQLNTTRLVGSGWDPALSGDGRFVAFVGREDGLSHIFLVDLQSGTTRIVTRSVRRGLANGASAKPVMSSNGRFVAFQSEASDLVAEEDFNLLWDVFVFDRMTSRIARVSGDSDGAWMEPSAGPSIDAHGSVIAFSSRHPTDASDKRNDFDLYVASMSSPQRRSAAENLLEKNSFRLSASASSFSGFRLTRLDEPARAASPLQIPDARSLHLIVMAHPRGARRD